MKMTIEQDYSTSFVVLHGGPDKPVAGTMAMPSTGILDPDFKYTPSHSTDLRETFKRARESMK